MHQYVHEWLQVPAEDVQSFYVMSIDHPKSWNLIEFLIDEISTNSDMF